MESFTPPKKSAIIRYLKDPLLYLTVVLILSGVALFTLYKNDKSSLAQKVKILKGSLQIASTKGSDAKNEEPSNSGPDEAPETSLAAAPSLPPASAAPAAAAVTDSRAPASTTPALSGPVATLYYAEVPMAALERLYQESQATGQFNTFGDYTAGILPDAKNRLLSPALKIRVLEKTEKTVAKTQQWFSGIHDPELEEDLGLSTFVELSEIENQVFRGNLEIVRNLREMEGEKGAAPQKNSYPAIFELGPGYGFFVAGVLPRKTPLAQAEELAAKAPAFAILKSQAFHNKQSEFVIFIEFEKKP